MYPKVYSLKDIWIVMTILVFMNEVTEIISKTKNYNEFQENTDK
jgi:hypothetical protein